MVWNPYFNMSSNYNQNPYFQPNAYAGRNNIPFGSRDPNMQNPYGNRTYPNQFQMPPQQNMQQFQNMRPPFPFQNSNTNDPNRRNPLGAPPDNSQTQGAEAQKAFNDPSIRFEPLSPDVLKMIEDGKQAVHELKENLNSEEEIKIINSGNFSTDLEKFIQHEKNASEYYRHLAEISDDEKLKDFFSEAQNSSLTRRGALNRVYNKHSGKNYDGEQRQVETSLKLKDGVRFALLEESNFLEELSDIYANAPDENSARALNAMMHKKMSMLTKMMLL